jgi:hypothetical protein
MSVSLVRRLLPPLRRLPVLAAALRASAALGLVVGVGLLPAPASAQSTPSPPEASPSDGARKLGREALVAFDAGQFAVASQRFRAALAHFEFPTLRLYLARSLERQGLLVEATREYDALLASPIAASEGTVGAGARDQARSEAPGVAARRARLVVRGASVATELAIDGVRTSAAALERGHPVNPGRRSLAVTRPGQPRQSVELSLGESERRELSLDDLMGARAVAAAESGESPGELSSVLNSPRGVTGSDASGGHAGWGSGAVVAGAITAALVGGVVVTGLLALDRENDFDTVNSSSDPSRHDARQRASRMQWLNAAFVAGAVVSGGTTVYFYLSPAPSAVDPAPRAAFLGLHGRF